MSDNLLKIDESESPFKKFFESEDKYLWMLPVVLLIGSIIEFNIELRPGAVTLLYLIPNIVFSLLDTKLLKSLGKPVPSHWTVAIVPIYIWQRLKLNNKSKLIFLVWIVTFILSIILSSLSADNGIEANACTLVTQIINNNISNGASCVGVKLGKEVANNFYKATATLDNGNEMGITVDLRKKGNIYVQIPN